MRLLNVDSLELEMFEDGPKAAYAILSHTWGEEEVSFQEMMQDCRESVQNKKGFAKIVGCCDKARSEGYQHVWIDTCCIDKSSSAELSEAINSMFKWYRSAEVCYAYLSDVVVEGTCDGGPSLEDALERSRWFTRGWTLQELLAPLEVIFFNSQWEEIGTRDTLRDEISEITGIPVAVLQMDQVDWDRPRNRGSVIGEYSVAQRMSWAANRHTTRIEDEAYCLMGLFDVNMPLLYGEGRKAFKRLQLEIMKDSYDPSLLAWGSSDSFGVIEGVLAQSPSMFEDCGDIDWKKSRTFTGVAAKQPSLGNPNLCHDIIGSSLRMKAAVTPPAPAGRLRLLHYTAFETFMNVVSFRAKALAASSDVERVDRPYEHDGSLDLAYLSKEADDPSYNSYTALKRSFHVFDYGFLVQHKSRDVVLVMLDGCMKKGKYMIGITLCTDSTGLLKRVHWPSRFVSYMPEYTYNTSTYGSTVPLPWKFHTLNLALSGTEVLQQPPLPRWAKCLVRVLPGLTATHTATGASVLPAELAGDVPYRLSHTIPETVYHAADCWYTDRWGQATDRASFGLRPCFSLQASRKTGIRRAMAFEHVADASLSFLVIFTLVQPARKATKVTGEATGKANAINTGDAELHWLQVGIHRGEQAIEGSRPSA
ncbi:heterokaryon incompatibility protein-domain-containing protein [Diplogelasinospora grovesii]|uniref:Heterokaryon incompatibility protein-domain-containing protein n=1 Tax=Diplogelasinospora grovesii TaxID=303347 RepID=A0AAN6S0C5_9PEZI|nr:heterokaryon incompatibility protein-domain-containing protein [Diplogelasinospora grovesii]